MHLAMDWRRLVCFAAILAPTLVLPSCGEGAAAATPAGGALTVVGSSTIGPVVAELAEQFERAHPGSRIDVETGGSSRGIAAVRDGQADIGMVSRALKREEADLRAHMLARDGIAMIVHSSLPILELERESIRRIYTGELTDWSALGGPRRPITVVHKAEGRSTQELFLAHMHLDAADVRAAIVIGENQQGIKTVSGLEGAIGYVSIGAAEAAQAEGAPIRMLALDGVAATSSHVRDGRYPLSRELNLVTRAERSASAEAFIEFCLSSAAAITLEENFLVPAH